MKRKLAVAALLLLWCAVTTAHPLGNNTINRQAAIRLKSASLELRYVVDLAEIPALMQAQAADTDRDGTITSEEWALYARTWANEVSRDLELELDQRSIPVLLTDPSATLQPGAAGLSTLRLEAAFITPINGGSQLRYADHHHPAQSGWKEIYITAASGISIARASVPQADRSNGLRTFPGGLGSGLPDELSATADLVLDATPTGAVPIADKPSAARATAAVVSAANYNSPPAVTDASAAKTPSGNTTFKAAPRVTAKAATDPIAQRNAAPIWRSAWPLFKLGVHHIATGWDHLAFLLGLLLMQQSFRKLVKVITAFTVAHSLTLALAANGWVSPPGALVEPAIALTIAYVGFVSLVWQRSRHSAALAFGFGLVHGFGFAGALAASVGADLPLRGAWLVNLASFNLGIEVFQLLLVGALVPLLAFAARYAWSGAATRLASLAVMSAGLVWFVARTGALA